MSELNIGNSVFVQSYKHDGKVHRTWSKALLIDVNEDCYVVVTDHSWVVEHDNRRWLTKEPAICFYYRKKWFNVISMIRRSGIYYYCNVASPSIYDGEAIKNVDYDLDVKVFPDKTYLILDENEFEYHSNMMNYSDELKSLCIKTKDEIVDLIEREEIPFDFDYTNDYILKYYRILNELNSENNPIK